MGDRSRPRREPITFWWGSGCRDRCWIFFSLFSLTLWDILGHFHQFSGNDAWVYEWVQYGADPRIGDFKIWLSSYGWFKEVCFLEWSRHITKTQYGPFQQMPKKTFCFLEVVGLENNGGSSLTPFPNATQCWCFFYPWPQFLPCHTFTKSFVPIAHQTFKVPIGVLTISRPLGALGVDLFFYFCIMHAQRKRLCDHAGDAINQFHANPMIGSCQRHSANVNFRAPLTIALPLYCDV